MMCADWLTGWSVGWLVGFASPRTHSTLNASQTIHERLFSIDVKAKEREREEEKAKRELADCTFKPEVRKKKKKKQQKHDGVETEQYTYTRT